MKQLPVGQMNYPLDALAEIKRVPGAWRVTVWTTHGDCSVRECKTFIGARRISTLLVKSMRKFA
jgi:hypothetical protein